MDSEVILIVDDDHQIAGFLSEKLLPHLGYRTLCAQRGQKALEILRNQPVSLMLVDLQLPDTSGLEILRQLRRENRSVPAILMTAHGSEHVAVEAFRLGIVDYLTKPFELDEIKAAISRALTESRLRMEAAQLTAQLKEQVSWLQVLSKVGRSVSSTLELDEVLRRIVEAGVDLTRAEEGFLALLDTQNGQLYMRAVKNIDESRSKTLRLPVNDSLIGSVVLTGKVIRTSRAKEEPLLKVSTGFLVNSLLHVPLTSKCQTWGVLSMICNSNAHSFTANDEEILASLADYAAVAIENAGLYQQAQQEICERKRVEEALRESEERYALAVRGANDGLWDWDLKTNQVYYSPRWKAMLGYTNEEIEHHPDDWLNRVHPEDIERLKLDISAHLQGLTTHFENEHRIRYKDGSYRWMLSRGIAVWDPDQLANRMAGSQSDITERKNAEQKLLHDAFYDTLTGLPNRALFIDRLRSSVERAKRRKDYQFAVLFLDLDRFKDVNDCFGHMIGDRLLIAIAEMLRSDLRSTDTVARLSGDEFVILLEDINDIHAATRVADLIQLKLTSPFRLLKHEVFISTSIGIVLSVTGHQRPEDVLRDADIAMYVAKANGKARYEIFNPSMRDRILQRLALETELRQAIEREELEVYYQPILSFTSGFITGFEALARWQHPVRGLLPPAEFIPLAEETGLIIPIDRWVLGEACRKMRGWQAEIPLHPPLTISVNLSSKQIAQPDLIEQIEMILTKTCLDAHSLKLEITESAILENNSITAKVIASLQGMGIEMQIDDFGTGYSSLGYLHQFPVDALKIDRSFISRIDAAKHSPEIAQTVVMLAHDMGMATVAEGVETEEQLDQLKALGCEYGQGNIIGKPMNAEAVSEFLVEEYSRKKLPLQLTQFAVKISNPE